MRLILRYGNGTRTEALLLARSAGAMRVTVPGCKDTVEFRMENGHWADEEGRRVAIEAILSLPAEMAAPRAMGALG